jgi:hypothetical protein
MCRFQRQGVGRVNDAGILAVVVLPAQSNGGRPP